MTYVVTYSYTPCMNDGPIMQPVHDADVALSLHQQ